MNQAPLAPSQISACIILAGGTGSRLGGVSKPDYLVNGQRLLDHLFTHIDACGGAAEIVAVAPPEVLLPPQVHRVLENPPLGGPLAGLGAGVRALSSLPDDAVVALCTCDAPLSPHLWGALRQALLAATEAGLGTVTQHVAGAIPCSSSAHTSTAHTSTARRHYLLGLYRLGALRSVKYVRHGAVHQEFRALPVMLVEDPQDYSMDVDTQADAHALSARLSNSLYSAG